MRLALSLALAVTASLASGCCIPDTTDLDRYAPAYPFHGEIVNCVEKHTCFPLCYDLFQPGPNESIDGCSVTYVDNSGGALVHGQLVDDSSCDSTSSP